MKLYYYLFIGLFFLFTTSCNKQKNYESISEINKVRVIQCKNDTSQQYMLYLPTDYTSKKEWPVIFAFDPHARGHIPVDSLKEAAEKFGYIIAGSNNSKNNLKKIKYTVTTLMNDVASRYHIDKNRMYVAGFSGGGRVASLVALQEGYIKGVISCAAGLPGINLSEINHKINFYGIVGNRDFNYLELMKLKNTKSSDKLNSYIEIFDGGHTWPPSIKLEEAVVWFELNAMREGIIRKNNSLINYQYNHFIKELDTTNNHYLKASLYKKAIDFLDQLKDMDSFKDSLSVLTQSDQYKKLIERINLNIRMEQKIREQSVHSFKTKDTGWWNKNINYIKTTKEKANNKITRNTFERILNYISMLGYTFSSKAIHDDHPAKAKKYLDIYQKADPGNPDVYYLMAQWYDDKESINKAIESLKKAFRLGLDKTKNIQKDFSPAIAKHDSLSCWRNY